MVRIRYTNVDGFLVSKPMVAGSDLITVILNPVAKTFKVQAEDNNATLFISEPHNSLSVLKIAAKAYVKGMGVNFEDEVRSKEVVSASLDDGLGDGGGLVR